MKLTLAVRTVMGAKLTILALVAIFPLISQAYDNMWLIEKEAQSCFGSLGAERNNDIPGLKTGLFRDNVIMEPSFDREVDAVVRTSKGTFTVKNNGSCVRSGETTEAYVTKLLFDITAEYRGYKLKGGTYERANKSGSHSMPAKDYLQAGKNLDSLLETCSRAKGSIGAAARASLNTLRVTSGLPQAWPSEVTK